MKHGVLESGRIDHGTAVAEDFRHFAELIDPQHLSEYEEQQKINKELDYEFFTIHEKADCSSCNFGY